MKSRKPWRSLRFRLIIWYSLLAGFSMMVSESIMFLELRRALFDQVDRALEASAIQALKNLDDGVNGLGFDPRQSTPRLATHLDDAGVGIYLFNERGRPVQSLGSTLPQLNAVPPDLGISTLDTPTGRWRIYAQEIREPNRSPAGWLIIARSLQTVDRTLNDLLWRNLFSIPILLILAGGGGFFMASRALKPIDKITEITRKIRHSGDLSHRIGNAYTTDDELTRLTQLFDEMLDSLQETFEQQERFIADASHELRTPLTTLRGLVQVTLIQTRDPETYVDTLYTISSEVERLIRLSSDLLLLSRLEQQERHLPFENVAFSDLLLAVADQIEPLADLNHITLSVRVEPDLRIQGSPDHLIRLFINLLDNAVGHTPRYGVVALQACLDQDSVRVRISDNGVGIPAQELPRIFDRFYRVGKSRSRSLGGAGLGLAIVHEIVLCHHGVITVESQPGNGTTFTTAFPRSTT